MVSDHLDDGVSATHYSYEWEGLASPAVLRSLSAMELPELHVWLAHRDPDTIIDPTVGTWVDRARAGGFAWTAVEPPAFLWSPLADIRSKYQRGSLAPLYEAHMDACRVADQFGAIEIMPRIAKHLGLGRG